MALYKLQANGRPDTMKVDEGNDSLDSLIRQAIGKEPYLSFSRNGDSPVQLIQLLHALDQPEHPGWPLLTPVKVQLQKCEKCSREFCSTINYRRHIRVHRRSLNPDKDTPVNRDLLQAFWDKISHDDAWETLSFNNVRLEEVGGSSILEALSSFIKKPGFSSFPKLYAKAGFALLDMIQAGCSRFPIPSQELFSILDDASEGTFLCGTAESMQKYIFDGEAGKIGLEMKNIVACTSYLLEQKLINTWVADKDAEALRCQKLLVEEEEADLERKSEMLERKRQKKLRQKEQRAKVQSSTVKPGSMEEPEASSSPATTHSGSHSPATSDGAHEPIHPELSTNLKTANQASPRRADPIHSCWHPRASPQNNPQFSRHGNGNKVWSRKPKFEDRTAAVAPEETPAKRFEVLIGSIPIEVGEDPKGSSKPDANGCGVKSWSPACHGEGVEVSAKTNARSSSSESCVTTCAMDESCGVSDDNSVEEDEENREFWASVSAAEAFLMKRWNEAMAGDHVVVLPSKCEPPGLAEVRKGDGGESRKGTAAVKTEFKGKVERGAKLKYIPRERTG